jgi:hypothetical protein
MPSKFSSLIAENFTVLTCITFLEKVHQDVDQYHVTPLLYRSNRCSVTSIVSEYTFLELGGMYMLSSPVHREEVTAHHFHNDAPSWPPNPRKKYLLQYYLLYEVTRQIFVFMWAERG